MKIINILGCMGIFFCCFLIKADPACAGKSFLQKCENSPAGWKCLPAAGFVRYCEDDGSACVCTQPRSPQITVQD